MDIKINEKEKKIYLCNEELKVIFNLSDITLDVIQLKSSTVWKMDTKDDKDFRMRMGDSGFSEKKFFSLISAKEKKVKKIGGNGVSIKLSNFNELKTTHNFEIKVFLEDNEVLVEIDMFEGNSDIHFYDLYYPRSFMLPQRPENFAILNGNQGELIPAIEKTVMDQRHGFQIHAMWWGGIQGKSAYAAIVETPYDFIQSYVNNGYGPCLFPRWYHSLKKFAYPRKIRYVFLENATYVNLVKRYKKFAEEVGYVKLLKEKIKEVPNVKGVIGAPLISEFIASFDRRIFEKTIHTTFKESEERIKKFKEITGYKKVVYHLDGWGRVGYDSLHPDLLPPLKEAGGIDGLKNLVTTVKNLGYLFLLHDNYNQYHIDSESFSEDYAIKEEIGITFKDHKNDGGTHSLLCPTQAINFIRRNYLEGKTNRTKFSPAIMEFVKPTATYLDQFFITTWAPECYHPNHMLNRRSYYQALMEIFNFMHSLGLATSCEHLWDFCMPVIDFTICIPMESCVPNSIPVPLFNMAYHDCFVMEMRSPDVENNEGEYIIEDFKSLFLNCLISGSLLYFITPLNKYTNVFYEIYKKIKDIYNLHNEHAFLSMDDHQLLEKDGSVQISKFGDISIFVDYNKGEYEIKGIPKLNGYKKLEIPAEPIREFFKV